MAKAQSLPAKENRRLFQADDNVDFPFLILVLLLLSVGLIMLYSAS
jgi:cell division protein FtsW (lipid II flippase)